ncbi:MAG: hypothetical protein KKD35_01675 [Elusimicrobia bacterium]|nr:hypothetical protein [Elusimicrobiota bacterium]
MTPPPLLSRHAKHGKFTKRINSAEMPNCDKAMPGVVSRGYAHQTTKPMAVPHCPHEISRLWRDGEGIIGAMPIRRLKEVEI